jgi:hypothetical protein
MPSSCRLAWSSSGSRFFGQLLGNVLQRRCIRRINQCSKVAIGLLRGSAQSLRAARNSAPCSTK